MSQDIKRQDHHCAHQQHFHHNVDPKTNHSEILVILKYPTQNTCSRIDFCSLEKKRFICAKKADKLLIYLLLLFKGLVTKTNVKCFRMFTNLFRKCGLFKLVFFLKCRIRLMFHLKFKHLNI